MKYPKWKLVRLIKHRCHTILFKATMEADPVRQSRLYTAHARLWVAYRYWYYSLRGEDKEIYDSDIF